MNEHSGNAVALIARARGAGWAEADLTMDVYLEEGKQECFVALHLAELAAALAPLQLGF